MAGTPSALTLKGFPSVNLLLLRLIFPSRICLLQGKTAHEEVIVLQAEEGPRTFPVGLSPLTLIFNAPKRSVRKVLLIWALTTGL